MNIATFQRWLFAHSVFWGKDHKDFQPPLHWLKLSFPTAVLNFDFQLHQGGLTDGYRLYFSQLLDALREEKLRFAIRS